MKPKKPALGKANQARRNAEASGLKDSLGTVRGGAHQNPADKRARTRSAATQKAIKEQDQ